uniref:Uncharacterized protein n=1 Tax=Arundo donax TaxID=35708 RepID=A0A0A9C5B9_ARUDO
MVTAGANQVKYFFHPVYYKFCILVPPILPCGVVKPKVMFPNLLH